MSTETHLATREKVRVFLTGACEGLSDLAEALDRNMEIDVVGSSEGVREAAATLTGGHLGVVLHGTRGASLPTMEIATIREHTKSPIILLASGECSALLE